MHRSAELLAALSRASGATTANERHHINNARRPIDVWRASPAGQRAEDGLRTAMANYGAARRAMLSQFLTAFAADLPAYIEGVLRHARAHPEWQPPFNDFTALGQHGLHLIENATFRLSLLAVEALPNTAPPPVVRFGDGEVLFCASAADADLSFHQWQLTKEHCHPLPRAFLHAGALVHADLADRSLSIAHCARPIALLRLQIHGQSTVERHFCARTGRQLPQILGGDAFRRHLALAALTALGRTDHGPDTLTAAQECGDDALAWHYMRHALALDGAKAAAVLTQWAEGERPALAPLARQTLAVLRAHYPTLEAA